MNNWINELIFHKMFRNEGLAVGLLLLSLHDVHQSYRPVRPLHHQHLVWFIRLTLPKVGSLATIFRGTDVSELEEE